MGSPVGTLRERRARFLLFAWGGAVLVAWVLVRDEDVRPVLAALGARTLDLALALGIPLGYLAVARRLRRALVTTGEIGSDLLVDAGVALALAMLWATAAGAVGGFSAGVLGAGPLLAALVGRREWPGVAADVRTLWSRRGPPGVPEWLAFSIAGAALLLALTPSWSQDALAYHLAVPALWLDAGKFIEIPGLVYAHFPMNTEMLYGTALALRGEIAAKAFHWLFCVLAALAVRSLARTWAGAAAARWAPVLFLAIPTVFRVATWAYVELSGICYLLLAWLLIVRATRAAGRDALVAGLLGVACGIKYTFLLPAAVIVLFTVVQAGGAAPLRALVGVGAALAGGGFWYVRNIVTVGNPCYPFLYSMFGGDGWDQRRAAVFQGFLEFWGSDLRTDPVTVTYGATFSSIERFDGIVGPAFLLGLPLVAVAIARRPAVRPTAALAGLLLASWFFTTHQIRFLVPALAFLAVLIPVGWQALEGASLRRMAHGLVVAAVLLALPSQLLLLGQSRPLAYAIGLESADQFLDRHIRVGDYEVYRRLPEYVPADGKVLFAGSGNPVYLCARPFHADSVDENHTLRELLRASTGPTDFARRFQANGFTHLLFRADVVLGDLSDLEVRERALLGIALECHGQLALHRGGTSLFRVSAEPRSGDTP